MNPATKPTEIDQPGAHLRLVLDRAGSSTPGIKLSGVSKTYRSRDGDVPSLRPRQVDPAEDDLRAARAVDRRDPGRRRAGDQAAWQCRHRVPEFAAAAVAQHPLQRDAADRHEAVAAR